MRRSAKVACSIIVFKGLLVKFQTLSFFPPAKYKFILYYQKYALKNDLKEGWGGGGISHGLLLLMILGMVLV